ncbi:MAG TPA: D-alanine--D-alanine ligase [Opitutae bacterium]|nr:D-alanine--D-alanine ligase [Opitutae bacterium]
MKERASISVLTGGIGPEREISLATGRALTESLARRFQAKMIDLTEPSLPEGIKPKETVVFPAIHGTFGEDGTLQNLLEQGGFSYCGSGPEASRLCMDKTLCKEVVEGVGVRVAKGFSFSDPAEVDLDETLSELGLDLIIKPTDQGSSFALFVVKGSEELAKALSSLSSGNWMIERRVFGRELTLGVLGGEPLGAVEVIPTGGVYDYERKYSPGSTDYRYPAELESSIEEELRQFSVQAFEACGCRDFARVDFIVCESGKAHFLEVNTLPGLTGTSLLPKSAACSGLGFDELTARLVEPALERFFSDSLLSA